MSAPYSYRQTERALFNFASQLALTVSYRQVIAQAADQVNKHRQVNEHQLQRFSRKPTYQWRASNP
eukprot:2557283-Amphidinium_carterae.1